MPNSKFMNVEPGEQISLPALSIRAKVPEKDLPGFVVKSYEMITAYLKEQNVQAGGAPFVAYYNIDLKNPSGDGTWDLEVGFPVPEIVPAKGEIKQSAVLAGKTISCLYKGPYKGLGKAYSRLSGWLGSSKYQSMNISYEYFYNSPNDVPEEELLTRVVLLIK